MSVHAVKSNQTYTYEDYLTWPDDERWEIIDGVAYAMSPSPTAEHQRISGNLFIKFGNFLAGKKCEVFHAPFDVRLPQKDETAHHSSSVVQPDITVICDPDKIDKKGCKGSPDLIIEILSPSTSRQDFISKRILYERNAVKEYWIVDPVHQAVSRFYYDTNSKAYGPTEYFSIEDTINPIIFPELAIKLEEVFPAARAEEEEDSEF